MSTQSAPRPPASSPPASSPPAPSPSADETLSDAGGPGSTTVGERVVERVAGRAVAEVDLATGTARHVLGVSLGRTHEDSPARVEATVDGGLVTLRVEMAVVWPASVRQVTRQVREHLITRVEGITGLRVAEVDIEVRTLFRETSKPPRVE